ncbi:DUF6153 family protein [Streptomyces cyaneofuscatus]|uniref:DUF6153 family protein n=1 Tax=Streptomyces TaxID=1883 RepID=UPI000978DB49|nr:MULTISPECIES: DUF6153 family protein [unclassified Streptomyces]ONI53663.1 hypothetical protein STIB_13640 [Streptomyces sp. IB2014 011-1]RDV51928.1 hypothetical protein DDV98_06790 [Streptomyces sp. IB2014 011-12]
MVSTVGGVRSGGGGGGVVCGQLLLLAALLFGIVTMHTVGHPAEHAPSSPSAPAVVAVSEATPDAAHPSHPSPEHSPMSGMDPLSVCLAVLGAWGLALVGAWLLLGLRADRRPLGTPVGAGLRHALRPNPPPSISVLASVSVLRI